MNINQRTSIILATLALTSTLAALANAQEQETEAPPPAKKQAAYDASVPEPTYKNVSYGPHGRSILDFWQATSNQPTPLVISIHGGGWNGGSKEQIQSFVDTKRLLAAGISVAAINYRFIKDSKNESPFVRGPMLDAARAVQFLRSKAKEWNIDKNRIAATGGSAGACTALWLAYHDDLADPKSSDPVAGESTRLMCVAPQRVQSTLDPQQMKSWIPNSNYGAHAFGLASFDEFLAKRDELLPVINEYSPYALLDTGDPPTYVFFPIDPTDEMAQKNPTHSPVFGVKLQERCQKLGVPCELVYPGAPGVKHATPTDYLIETLTAKEKK